MAMQMYRTYKETELAEIMDHPVMGRITSYLAVQNRTLPDVAIILLEEGCTITLYTPYGHGGQSFAGIVSGDGFRASARYLKVEYAGGQGLRHTIFEIAPNEEGQLWPRNIIVAQPSPKALDEA